jgi:hypothetical protein
LISTILSLSTTRLPFNTLDTSLSQVSIYLSKFRTRLSANHVLHLKRLITFLEAFKRYSTEWLEAAKGKKQLDGGVEVMTVAELMQRLGRKAESINLLEIESYIRSSKVLIFLSRYRIRSLIFQLYRSRGKLADIQTSWRRWPQARVSLNIYKLAESQYTTGRPCQNGTSQTWRYSAPPCDRIIYACPDVCE